MKTLIADDRRRVEIPAAKPGQVFAYEEEGGVVTLTPVQESERKERPYDPHMYDNYPQELIDLEAASAKVDVGSEERDRE